jgi:hypothetical protein
MQAGELDGKWYAKYWNPVMAPLPEHIREAIDLGPQAPALCVGLGNAGALSEAGYQELENGYALFEDGSMHVAALTRMPGVSPAMWDWWFWVACHPDPAVQAVVSACPQVRGMVRRHDARERRRP